MDRICVVTLMAMAALQYLTPTHYGWNLGVCALLVAVPLALIRIFGWSFESQRWGEESNLSSIAGSALRFLRGVTRARSLYHLVHCRLLRSPRGQREPGLPSISTEVEVAAAGASTSSEAPAVMTMAMAAAGTGGAAAVASTSELGLRSGDNLGLLLGAANTLSL